MFLIIIFFFPLFDTVPLYDSEWRKHGEWEGWAVQKSSLSWEVFRFFGTHLNCGEILIVAVAQVVEQLSLWSECWWPVAPWSLCPWARHFTHFTTCKCVWLLYVWGGGRRGRRRWMAAMLPLVCPRAPVATILVDHHQYDCVWINGT